VGLLALGWGLAFSFCAMHECAHRTAFSDRQRNDTLAWWFGVLIFTTPISIAAITSGTIATPTFRALIRSWRIHPPPPLAPLSWS
jgi:hypothetical protein